MSASSRTPAGLLDIESLHRSEIEVILERARFFQPPPNESYRRLDVLRGKTVQFEPVPARANPFSAAAPKRKRWRRGGSGPAASDQPQSWP